ncbi:MAG: hypothetical protein H7Y37_15925 [Anaerolineae bacterium]|nr:hypothetical protein [Gloeobacterales cyanobacterium ES-bin-313]
MFAVVEIGIPGFSFWHFGTGFNRMILAGQDWHIVVVSKEMANGTKGRGKPRPLDSRPVGDGRARPPHPSANF